MINAKISFLCVFARKNKYTYRAEYISKNSRKTSKFKKKKNNKLNKVLKTFISNPT